ncbi:MAG: hypothetical protein QW279_05100 [Candidatus Jordarchaeaceae archaeon]
MNTLIQVPSTSIAAKETIKRNATNTAVLETIGTNRLPKSFKPKGVNSKKSPYPVKNGNEKPQKY